MMRFLILLALVLITSPLMAQDNQLKPLPDVQSLDLQTFVSQSTEINKTFEDDRFINFSVQLPNSFEEKNPDLLKNEVRNDRLYGEIYRSNGLMVDDVYPYFSLKSFLLDRAISAKNWLVSTMLRDGNTLRSLESNDQDDTFEALYVRFGELDNTEVVRAKGYLRGPRMIVAEYVLPVSLWSEQADYQTYAIKSFELKDLNDDEPIEVMKSYSYLNSFSMLYPESWIMGKDVKTDENRIDLSLKSAGKLRVVFANIDISVVSTRSLQDAVDRSVYPTKIPDIINARKDAVIAQDFIIGDLMERHKYDLAIDSKLQVTEVYPLRKKLTDYVTHREAPVSKEFWVTVVKGTDESGKSYILSMVLPSRDKDLDNWALGTKAYELMIESIR